MVKNKRQYREYGEPGFSLMELVIVIAMIGVVSAIAIPQIIAQRRLTRSATVTREIATNIRLARQLAMARRAAFTFQYDDTNKQLNVIGPIPVGTVALADPAYPNNTGSSVVASVQLTQGGLLSSEIVCGIPTAADLPTGAPAVPTVALPDGISRTNLTSNKLNITFQPDGSVIDSTGSLANRALYVYNNRAAQETATAISVIGASGRVKVWRYTTYGNTFTE